MLPRAHGLPAVRIWLLMVGVVLLSATVVALAVSAYPSRAATSHRMRKTASSRASERRATRKKSSSVRRTKCVAAARAGKHRKSGKRCVVKRPKTSGTKPSVRRGRSGAELFFSPSVASTGTQAPANGGAPPTDVPKGTGSESRPLAPVEPAAPFRFFAPTSFWNAPLPADAPPDPSSASVVGALDEEIAAEEQAGRGPWIDTTAWSVPVYTVSADQPTVPVQLEGNPTDTLSSALSAVPLPPDAQPAAGTDGQLVVWQPSTDRLWEFWRLAHEAGGWQASWGGAMQRVSSDQGVYGPEAWPGAKPWWGASGSSLSLVGGLISLEDLELGQINHAVAMAIPNVRAGVYASPAQRSDGTTADPLSLPEGAHLRLDPNLNLAALHLPRLTLMIAEAAQRYGIFIKDNGGNVGFSAQDPIPTGTEPYTGSSGYFEGKSPSQLLASFPWSDLQLLKMELHSTS